MRTDSIVFKLFGLIEAKIEGTRHQVETARSVAQTFHERAKAGEFDEKTAQELAKTAIRGMRYGSADANGYAYSPDLIRFVRKLVAVTGIVAETSGAVRDSSVSLSGEAAALRGEADKFLSSVAA